MVYEVAPLAGADHRVHQQALTLQRLSLRRIDAELAGRLPQAEPDDDPVLFAQIQAQAATKRQAIDDAVAQEQAMLERARQELRAANETIDKFGALLPSLRHGAEAYGKLQAQGFISTVTANEQQRQWIEKQGDLRAQRATAASLQATIGAQTRKLAQLHSAYQSELRTERTQVMGQIARLEQEVGKTAFRNQVLELRAPQDGVVKEIATTTRGAVLQPGTVLASIVPRTEPLVAEVRIRNDDIGFVEPGQAVQLKLAAYPFQKYGLLPGHVRQVAPDATVDPARRDGAEPLPFKAVIVLDDDALLARGRRYPLAAGMTVQAELRQGSRTVLEYLLSPVQGTLHEAARER